MTDINDDMESFTIALTPSVEPPESKMPWLLIGAALLGAYLLLRKRSG